VSEISAPAALRMKAELGRQLRAAEPTPKEHELSFEPRRRSGIAMAQELHAPARLSKQRRRHGLEANGFSSFTPVWAKSAVFRVTRVS
jgi:hypothetical protein